MNSRLKAGLLGLLNHRDPAIAARARKDLGASADPADGRLRGGRSAGGDQPARDA